MCRQTQNSSSESPLQEYSLLCTAKPIPTTEKHGYHSSFATSSLYIILLIFMCNWRWWKRHCVCSKVHYTESLSTHISWAWQSGQEQDKNWFFWLVMICRNEKQFSVRNFFLHSIIWRSWVMPTKLCWCLQLLHHHIQSMLTPSQDQPHRLIVSQSVNTSSFFLFCRFASKSSLFRCNFSISKCTLDS